MNRRSFLLSLAGLVSANTLQIDSAGAISSPQQSNPGFRLVDVTSQSGIHFSHNSGAYGGKFLPETMGSGCAFLDYDGDG